MRWVRSVPVTWTATMGVSLLLLALWLVAETGAVCVGRGWLMLAAALDPAISGSIPDLWALLLLLVAAAVAWCVGRSGAAAAVPLMLAAADGADLNARLVPVLGWHPVPAKLAVGAALGAAALTPALLLWRRSCFIRAGLGRRLAVPMLAWGAAALGLDAVGSAVAAAPGHWLAVVEEAIEVLLYATLAARLLDGARRLGDVSAECPVSVHSAARAVVRSP